MKTPVRSPAVAPRITARIAVPRVVEREVYLHPGHLHAAARPTTITTILGSCVTVCLHDPARGIGGANHFLLPQHTRDVATAERYGPAAMRTLLDRMLRLGARREAMTAYVAGGACVLAALQTVVNQLGQRNAEVAYDFLAAEGIRVVGASVGGTRGRKLVFTTADGAVAVHTIGVAP